MKKAQTNVMLMDSTKIDCGMPYTFAKLADVDILITDQPLPAKYLKAAKQARITVI
jgi:DeoR/GlpR family transcriptional regulator of sugar metabolism